MSKIILKTALKTLLAVFIALIAGFAVLSLGFPRTMASFLEDGGSYSFAAGYCSLSYSYSGDIKDLARCVNDYVAAGDDRHVAEFGDKLVRHENFAEYCDYEKERLGLDYRQYICGKICYAYYRLGHRFNAMQIVESAMDHVSFPAGNALVQLILLVEDEKDKDFADDILAYMKTITPQESERAYYDAAKSVLENLVK